MVSVKQKTLFSLGVCVRCSCVIPATGKQGRLARLCVDCGNSQGGKYNVHRVRCEQCGREAWKQRADSRFCSQECHNTSQKAIAHLKPCKNCGHEFRCKHSDWLNGRAYCSDQCRRSAWGQDNQPTCEECGKQFPRWKAGRSKNRFCSRQCSCNYRTKQRKHADVLRNVKRLVHRLRRRFVQALKAARTDKLNADRGQKKRSCLRCGKQFSDGRNKLCSIECRVQSRRINRRSGKHARVAHSHRERCRIRRLPFDSSITKQFVHDRDNWTCQLCGVRTIQGDRRFAATIGHIVPLNNPLNVTHGHVATNTFTNCATCNGKQGNAVVIDGHQHAEDPRTTYLRHVAGGRYPFKRAQDDAESRTLPPREFLGN